MSKPSYADNTYRNLPEYIAAVCIILAALLAMTWVAQGQEFFLYRFFAPKMEQARRETFEQSKAYNDGAQQDLRRMQLEYIKATPVQQDALAAVILHQMAGYDESKLAPDLRDFINQIKAKSIQPTMTETIR